MAVSAKLDEITTRKMAEWWTNGAESGNGRRLPHNSGSHDAGTIIYAKDLGKDSS